jgi:hypothetical protein
MTQPSYIADGPWQPPSKFVKHARHQQVTHGSGPSSSSKAIVAAGQIVADQSSFESPPNTVAGYAPVPVGPPNDTIPSQSLHSHPPRTSSVSGNAVCSTPYCVSELAINTFSQNHTISQSVSTTGSQPDSRIHEDGGTRLAGGPPEEDQSFSPSRDIPPAYGRY